MAKKAKSAKKSEAIEKAKKGVVRKTEPVKPVSKTIYRLRKGLSRY